MQLQRGGVASVQPVKFPKQNEGRRKSKRAIIDSETKVDNDTTRREETYNSLDVDVGVLLEQCANNVEMITFDGVNQDCITILQTHHTRYTQLQWHSVEGAPLPRPITLHDCYY